MSLTTAEVVTVDGVDLNTLAYNLETLSGRDALPPRRGENIQIAYATGRKWARKRFDQKTETWAMWVRGCDVDGNVPVTGARAEYNANLYMLKQLFGKTYEPLALQKIVSLPSGLLTLSAEGECESIMEPRIVGNSPTLARFTADVVMADPLWYAAEVTESFGASGDSIVMPGTTVVEKMVITISGPTSSFALTNQTTGSVIEYGASIAGGVSLEIDTDQFTSYLSTGATAIGNLYPHGSISWMEMRPGTNVFTVSSLGGSIASIGVEIAYRPAYL